METQLACTNVAPSSPTTMMGDWIDYYEIEARVVGYVTSTFPGRGVQSLGEAIGSAMRCIQLGADLTAAIRCAQTVMAGNA